MMSSNRVLLAKNASIKSCANPTDSITEAVVEYCGVLIHPISHSANITPPNQVKLDALKPNSKPPNPKTRHARHNNASNQTLTALTLLQRW